MQWESIVNSHSDLATHFFLSPIKRMAFTPFIKGIGSVVKYLCKHAFELEEWKSILANGEARDGATDELQAISVLLAGVKQRLYIRRGRKRLIKDKRFQALCL